MLLDQLAAAVRAVQDRLQREHDQKEAHERRPTISYQLAKYAGALNLPTVKKSLALMFRHILQLWW